MFSTARDMIGCDTLPKFPEPASPPPDPESKSMKRTRIAAHRPLPAFTLVELLVTIAILGILAALLFPAAQAIRATTASARCVSNLKQVNTLLLSYAGERGSTIAAYDGGQAWMNPLVTYAGITTNTAARLLNCPANPRLAGWYRPASNKGGCNFSLVYRPFGIGTVAVSSDSFRSSRVSRPSQLVMISDGALPLGSGTNTISHYRIDRGEMRDLPRTPANFFHNGGINIAFFDGSVRHSKTNELDYEWWGTNYQNP